MPVAKTYDGRCTLCPRLADYLAGARKTHPTYHSRPVRPFGELSAQLLIVGLAPGFHGANATGRPFTGDHAGILLFRTLHAHGFASQPEVSGPDDGQTLHNCRITNAVKCVPPANKPVGAEIARCNRYLSAEIAQMPRPLVIVALGGIAHRAVLRALGMKQSALAFGHAARHEIDTGLVLIDSYHCSRYNTQTRRLTEAMFDSLFADVAATVAAFAADGPDDGPA